MRLLWTVSILLATAGARAWAGYAPTIAETKELDRLFDLYRKPGGAALTLEARLVKNGISYDAMAFQSGATIPGCDPQTEAHCFAIDSWYLTVDIPDRRTGEIHQVRWRFYADRANRSEDVKVDGHIARSVEYARERAITDADVVEASSFALDLLLHAPNGYDTSPAIFEH